MRQTLSFDDVLVAPSYSDIEHRSEIDIGTNFLGKSFRLPIISANMNHITEYDMADAMTKGGGFYVVHRFMEDEQLYDIFDAYLMNSIGSGLRMSFSVGVRDPEHELEKVRTIAKFGGGALEHLVVTIDIAHGHHSRVADMVKRLKDFGIPYVIAGNIATAQGYRFLADAGADAVKVGIGPGSVCTTRETTGVGVPQLSAIQEIIKGRQGSKSVDYMGLSYGVKLSRNYPAIIADGGIKSSGDIVKALAAGADMVMLGSLLAGTTEAPGERRVDKDGTVWAPYVGQSIFGTNRDLYTPEGISGWVRDKGPVAGVLKSLAGGITSGLSYVGARNISELRDKAQFVSVTQASHLENGTRVRSEI